MNNDISCHHKVLTCVVKKIKSLENYFTKKIGFSGLFKKAIKKMLLYIKPLESQASVKQGINSEKDISTLLSLKLSMIWIDPKNVTREQLSPSENLEIYNRVYDFEDVDRQLWCYNMFSVISFSCRNGKLGNIKDQLKTKYMFHNIFTGCSKFRKRKIIDANVAI